MLGGLVHMFLMVYTRKVQQKQSSKDELQKYLFCWGGEDLQFVCLSEETCGHKYVLVLRPSSDWKSSDGGKPDLCDTHQDECMLSEPIFGLQ